MSKTTISASEFLKKINTERLAREFFETVRWPNGVYCPKCNSADRIRPRSHGDGYYWCGYCRKVFSVRTGTILHRSHIPYRKWLYVMYLLEISREGVPLTQVAKKLEITRKSAQYMLHRLWEACGGDEGILSGVIKINPIYMDEKDGNRGTKKRIKESRGPGGSVAVVDARECSVQHKATSIKGTRKATTHSFIRTNVTKSSCSYTADHVAHKVINSQFSEHELLYHRVGEYMKSRTHTNGIENIWVFLKHRIHCTYHRVSKKYLCSCVTGPIFDKGCIERHVIGKLWSLCDHLAHRKWLVYATFIGTAEREV